MDPLDLRRIDLNLLKAFEALERYRSVTKAAERLYLGQPAMSHALSRLRELVRDELFVRGPGGMVPTSRALELIGPVRSALAQIENVLSGAGSFDPSASDVRFRLGMTDFVAAAVLPRLSGALSESAPAITLAMRNADRINAAEMLDADHIDLAIGLFPQCARWHRRAPLFVEDHICIFNPHRIDAAVPITLDDFVRYRHVLVTLRGDDEGFVDELLRQRGLRREIAISTSAFLLVGVLVDQLPVIATVPRRHARVCALESRVVASPLPFESPRFQISLMWHARNDDHPGLVFLRQAIVRTLSNSEALL